MPIASRVGIRMSKLSMADRAKVAVQENRYVDFKRQIDVVDPQCKCEIVKDVVAMANSGGGIIVAGVEDDGRPSTVALGGHFNLDPADLTTAINNYTNCQFSNFEIVDVVRAGNVHRALLIGQAETLMVFTRPGTYPIQAKPFQASAFAKGTIYFRHGGKSEPGDSNDLRAWLKRELDQARRGWMSNVVKVIKAPPGAEVAIGDQVRPVVLARIGSAPGAQAMVPINPGEIFPYRSKELLELVNERLDGVRVNSHDLQCLHRQHKLLERPEFVIKPHAKSAPIYSDGCVNWIVERVERNPQFLADARAFYKANNRPPKPARRRRKFRRVLAD
jgi:hypothetical protein